MALLNGLENVAKGSSATITIDKTQLMTLSSVAADTYFSDSANISKVVVVYGSSAGNERVDVTFDMSQASPSDILSLSSQSRDTFSIVEIIMYDFDGGYMSVSMSDIPVGLNISLSNNSGGSGGNSAPTVVLSTASYPVGIAEDSAGNIYASDWILGGVRKYDSSGAFIASFGSGQCRSVAVDEADFIYTINYNDGNIYKYDTVGNLVLVFYSGMNDGYACAVSPGGDVYAAMGMHNCILHFNSEGTIVQTFDIGHHAAQLVASSTRLVFEGAGSLEMMDLDGSNHTTISPWVNIAGLATDAQGYIYTGSASYGTAAATLVKFNPDGSNPTVVDANVNIGWVYGYGKQTHKIYTSPGGATDTLTRWSAN